METLTEILSEYHLAGLFIGLATFLIIGMFHPIVIKFEYHFGVKCWWWFLIAGIVGVILSLMTDNLPFSALLGVFAFSSFWGIGEIFEQRKRVEHGWFPANPKRKCQEKDAVSTPAAVQDQHPARQARKQ